MTTEDSASGGTWTWPGPVFFHQDDPKKGFVYISMNVPGMTVSSAFMKDKVPKNATILNKDQVFPDPSTVDVQVKLDKTDTESVTYEYKKPLPKKIVPSASKLKFKKDVIIIEMKKEDAKLSWAPYEGHLTSQTQ